MVPSLVGNQTALTTIDLAGNPARNIRAARCVDVDAGTDAANKQEEAARKALRVAPPPEAANSRVPHHPSEADRSVAPLTSPGEARPVADVEAAAAQGTELNICHSSRFSTRRNRGQLGREART
jgi:hypothetical protein